MNANSQAEKGVSTEDESHDVERGDEIIVDDVADSRQPMTVRVIYHDGALKAIDQFEGVYRVSAGDVSDRVDVVDDDSDEIATDGGRMPCPHRMRASMDLARRWDIDRDDARAFLVELGFLVELER